MKKSAHALILAFIICITSCGKSGINIDFKGNGSTSGKRPAEDTHYNPGETVIVPGNTGGFAKTGSAFAGWTSAPDGTGKYYAPGAVFTMGSEKVTLYAKWVIPGTVDSESFAGAGADDTVYAIAVQPDGKIIVGGAFEKFNGSSARHIVRLNADGTIDKTFNTGTGPNFEVVEFAFQPDGKIMVLGNFFLFDKVDRNRIARLNPDGSLDLTFNPGKGFQGDVRSINIQKDGKMILAGWFNSYNGGSTMYIIRLNSDGSVDNTFNTGKGPNSAVFGTVILPDGKILIAGRFSSYNGTKANCIARLNPDGSIDNTFNSGDGAGGIQNYIQSIDRQKDGKIIIAGYFTSYNGIERNRIARLNPDGSIDKSFDPGKGADQNIMKVTALDNGRILAMGWFHMYADKESKFFVQISSDGSPDRSLSTGSGPEEYVLCMAAGNGTGVFLGGEFHRFSGKSRGHFVRLWN